MMENRSRRRAVRVRPAPQTAPARAVPEPPVRHWPHPVEGREVLPQAAQDPMLHYVRCALSYQNQMLADIKTLLQKMEQDAERR